MWSGICQSLTPPFKDFFNVNQGAAWAPVAFSYASDMVQPGFVNGGPKGGSEATKRGEGGRAVGIFFWKFVYENGIFLHIKYYY